MYSIHGFPLGTENMNISYVPLVFIYVHIYGIHAYIIITFQWFTLSKKVELS